MPAQRGEDRAGRLLGVEVAAGGQRHILEEACAAQLFLCLPKELRVRDGEAAAVRHQLHQRLLGLVVPVGMEPVDVEHTDHIVPPAQGDGQHRLDPGVFDKGERDAAVDLDVHHVDGQPLFGHLPGDALAHGDAVSAFEDGAEAGGGVHDHIIAFPEEDGSRVQVHDAGQMAQQRLQQLVQIQRAQDGFHDAGDGLQALEQAPPFALGGSPREVGDPVGDLGQGPGFALSPERQPITPGDGERYQDLAIGPDAEAVLVHQGGHKGEAQPAMLVTQVPPQSSAEAAVAHDLEPQPVPAEEGRQPVLAGGLAVFDGVGGSLRDRDLDVEAASLGEVREGEYPIDEGADVTQFGQVRAERQGGGAWETVGGQGCGGGVSG